MKAKILSNVKLEATLKNLRRKKKKIGFTNGTFDILHLGHIRYLQKAKSTADILIVGVNTDRSVKSYKAPNRPINAQAERLEVLAALECVDYVILFDDPTPLNLICKIRPHVLIKGADWKKEDIVGAKEVESWGGKVRRITFVAGKSTTGTIEKILQTVK